MQAKSRGAWTVALMYVAFSLGASTGSEAKPSTKAARTNAEWTYLSDEPSRSELFKKIIQARQAETPKDKGPMSAPLKGKFGFPHDSLVDDATGLNRADSIFGIDVSHYTSSKLKMSSLRLANVSFVYVKATQGLHYADKKFPEFWSKIEALPAKQQLYKGAYHFLSAAGSGEEQADSFLRFVNKAGGFGPNDLPPCLDLEWDVDKATGHDLWLSQAPDEIIGKATAWMKRVQNVTGKIPVVYTNRAWWKAAIKSDKDFEKLSNFKIWIADYSGTSRNIEVPVVPNKAEAHLWQFTETARVSGFSGDLDANIYKGKMSDFLADMQVH